MKKSGAKLIGVGFVAMILGVVLGYFSDDIHGSLKSIVIGATIILCIVGAATITYGIIKLLAGMVKKE